MSNQATENMTLWDKMTPVEDQYKTTTYTYNGKALTSVKAYEAMRRMTQIFGPMGYGWGANVLENLKQGVTFQMRINLWYKPHFVNSSIPISEVAYVEAWGGTEYNDADWDMAKKAMTNAISKAISFLGFASGIYLEGDRNETSNPASPPPPVTNRNNTSERGIVAHDWDTLINMFIDTRLPYLEGFRYHCRFVKEYEAYSFSLRNVPSGASQEMLRSAGFKFCKDKNTNESVFYVHVEPEIILELEQSPEFQQYSASHGASAP